jgi:hypothetical protein
MSIEIIGSNGTKLKLMTKDKIDSILTEKEITYNLYKKKYLDSGNNVKCQLIENHLLIQLIRTFYHYDNSQTFDFNMYKFQKYLQQISHTTNLMEYINIFMIQNKLFDKLNLSIITILKKLYESEYDIDFIELNNNYYLDLLMLVHLLQNKSNKFPETLLNSLIQNIKDLDNYITDISIIVINNGNIKDESNNKCSNIISILDIYLNNIKSIKGNILKIDSLINIIIENIYKFYNSIE